MDVQQAVYVVDNDAAVRKSLEGIIEKNNFRLAVYASAEAFLDDANVDCASCMILNMLLEGQSAFDLLKRLNDRPKLAMSVIAIAGVGNVSGAVRSLRMGVHHCLEALSDPDALLDTIRGALAADEARRASIAREAEIRTRMEQLTAREREVLNLICEGKSTKEMACLLSISAKTVSMHRWHLMTKLKAASATEVMRLAFRAQAA